MNANDICTEVLEVPDHIEVSAKLELIETIAVDTEEWYSNSNAISELAKRRCREMVIRNLYGQVQGDARKAYHELRHMLGTLPTSFDYHQAMECLNRVFSPLLSVGNDLAKAPDSGRSTSRT